jgi:hypothetical protein
VEGHSLQVVKALNHKEVVWTMYEQIVKDIKMVLRNCEYWEIRHIKRDGNRAAHLLIKMSACLNSNRVWFNCFPDCIKDIVTSELLSLVMQSFLLLSVFMILMKSVSSSQKKIKNKKICSSCDRSYPVDHGGVCLMFFSNPGPVTHVRTTSIF